ncbi:MAG: phosphodiester glycosidase family protein [Myxacorys chilensis ATA2-1-KO14]|nr:phosphodiester glycosidase family protein [Myxacorys chilensis ATA2-1-KO14]
MQTRTRSKRYRRRTRRLSSPGSTFITLTCAFLTCVTLLPKLWEPQASTPPTPSYQKASRVFQYKRSQPLQKQAQPPQNPSQQAEQTPQSAPLSFQEPKKTEQPRPTNTPKSPVEPALAKPVPEPVTKPIATRPVTLEQREIAGIPIHLINIDLTDPNTFISVGLANAATEANSTRSTKGDEAFNAMVKRYKAAVTANGTFFSMDAQKRVMGNMVSGGRFLKYSPWENYGTTLGLRPGNRPEMITARAEGQPKWEQHWFSLTAGPRLLKQGELSINPKQEGFTDRAVMGVATRSAIGFSEHGKRLLLVTFHKPVSLQKEAAIMKTLGCYEAMNLDGGTSVALAQGDRVLQPAGRDLTNVITIYDAQHPAPDSLQRSWAAFQKNDQVALRQDKS